MNIISFEERTFEGIAAKFEDFVQRVDNLCRRHGERKIDEWMDNHDVCRKLRISPRTLQTLRDNGTLAFSRLVTRPTTVPKMLNALSGLWRTDARKPNGEVEPFDRVK